MKKNLIILFFSILLISNLVAEPVAEWSTSMGDFQIQLRGDLMPITVTNFVELTNAEFYDGLIFHRVIADFMIQDGCPLGTGTGGPGYTIQDEWNPLINFNTPGILGMAKTSAPNSAGSQYFITVVPTTWLNENYAAFGTVLGGMDIVNEISVVPTNASDKPLEDVVINTIRIISPQIVAQFPETSDVVLDDSASGLFWVSTFSELDTFQWYVNGELQDSDQFTFNYNFQENGYYVVEAVISQNGYEEQVIWNVTVSALDSDENLTLENMLFQNIPNPFNPTTEIKFNLAYEQQVKLSIYNTKGQLVNTLLDGSMRAGINSAIWNGDNFSGNKVASGVYMFRLEGDNFVQSKKAILLK